MASPLTILRKMRKPKDAPPYEVDIVSGVQEGHYVEPYAPIPGGVKMVQEQRPPKRKSGELQAAKSIYKDYVQSLLKYQGNEVFAIADVLGITREEAEERKHELHARLCEPVSSNRSLVTILNEMDLSKEARLAILRHHAYSDIPAASLKAIDAINAMDHGRTQDVTSYEAYLRNLMK